MSDNKYDLDKDGMSESVYEVKPSLGDRISSFFNRFTQKKIGPGESKIQYTNKSFSSWERSAAISDFFSSVGETAQKLFSPVTNTISSLANKIKESAEQKRYNSQSKDGISVYTIEGKPMNNPVIMPSTGEVLRPTDDTVIMAGTQVEPVQGIIDNAKTAEQVRAEAEASGIKLEEMEVDEEAVDKSATTKDAPEEVVQPAPQPSSMTAGEINVGQPEHTKDEEDFEK